MAVRNLTNSNKEVADNYSSSSVDSSRSNRALLQPPQISGRERNFTSSSSSSDERNEKTYNNNPFLQASTNSSSHISGDNRFRFQGKSSDSSSNQYESSSNLEIRPHSRNNRQLRNFSALQSGDERSDNKYNSEYKGYYSKGMNSPYAHRLDQYSSDSGQNRQYGYLRNNKNDSNGEVSNNDIKAPPPFDRYPQVGDKLVSSDSYNKLNKLVNQETELVSSNSNKFLSTRKGKGKISTSSSSTSLFPTGTEFAPLGEYLGSIFPLLMNEPEDDDYMHNPDPAEEARLDRQRFIVDLKNMDKKSFGGWLGIFILLGGAIAVFVVLPALTFTGAVDHPKHRQPLSTSGTGSNTTMHALTNYQYPTLSAIRTSLVDPDTPETAYTRKARDGSSWDLVFSDEFNAEGRTFYEGDDQFWTAPDIHYDATKDLEWYSPDAATTRDGTLKLRMDAFRNHDLYYRSGMLQSWNKICFTQGALEVSANLPNYGRVSGLWPGLWTMGNLARPGYLASSEGVWPYSYDSCDAGITPNQSSPDGISYLPGQRLSACTCDGEDHPNPGVGRGAPEIDILEGEADTTLGVGVASQSLQVAPFDIWYMPDYDFIEIYNFTTTVMNTYAGGPFQQAISAVTTLNTSWYEFGPGSGYFQRFAIEYLNDDENGYIRWFVGDTPTMTLHSKALHPNGNIGWRQISKEPMSIVMNLGISNNWAYIDWQSIYFPVTMSIDYVRLYQPPNSKSVTCDPDDYPTYDYIQDHLNVYTNANLTSWTKAGYSVPKNQLTGNCKSSKFKISS